MRCSNPNTIDVDMIMISYLSKEEQEKHIRENLCFICHKGVHQSKECPMRKEKKGKSSGGKGKRRFKTQHHIRAALEDGSDVEEEEDTEVENSQSAMIRRLIAKMTPEERLEILSGINKQDFQ